MERDVKERGRTLAKRAAAERGELRVLEVQFGLRAAEAVGREIDAGDEVAVRPVASGATRKENLAAALDVGGGDAVALLCRKGKGDEYEKNDRQNELHRSDEFITAQLRGEAGR